MSQGKKMTREAGCYDHMQPWGQTLYAEQRMNSSYSVGGGGYCRLQTLSDGRLVWRDTPMMEILGGGIGGPINPRRMIPWTGTDYAKTTPVYVYTRFATNRDRIKRQGKKVKEVDAILRQEWREMPPGKKEVWIRMRDVMIKYVLPSVFMHAECLTIDYE